MSHLAAPYDLYSDDNLPREMHQVVKSMIAGNEVNHIPKSTMSLRLPNGNRATNDKENMSVMLPHCQRMFNNHRLVSPQALEKISQRELIPTLDDPITWKEFKLAIRQMKNNNRLEQMASQLKRSRPSTTLTSE